MAKYSSTNVSVLVDGYVLTAALTETITRANEAITQQSNPFGVASEQHTPVGMVKGTLSVGGGIFDEAVDILHAGVAGSGVGVSRIVCVCDQGQTKGQHFTGYQGAYSQKYEVIDTNGQLTKANVTYQVSGTVNEHAVILQELAAKTSDWDTSAAPNDAADDPLAEQIPIATSSLANPSIITTTDNHGLVSGDVVAIFGHTSVAPDITDSGAGAWQYIGHTVTVTGLKTFTIPVSVSDAGVGGYCVVVSRATGGAGYCQVTAGATFTNFVGTIKHSVDASTWATLITFADTTTDRDTAQRVATATTTTQVRRYLAFYGDVTGAGSITVFAGFGRGQ
jgi:hypothetical protein